MSKGSTKTPRSVSASSFVYERFLQNFVVKSNKVAGTDDDVRKRAVTPGQIVIESIPKFCRDRLETEDGK